MSQETTIYRVTPVVTLTECPEPVSIPEKPR